MGHPITVLWSVPRSVSTSFERMVSERGDHTVFDEPFSRTYYFSPERRSDRYQRTIPASTAAEIVAEVEAAAEERPVFVKDMAYQAVGVITDVATRWRSCFMVRDPSAALRSLVRTWPDFTDDETGWEQLGVAADAVEAAGQPLVVVDAHRLCTDPDAVVRAWCAAMGLEHRPETLTWRPGMRPEWRLWEEWHTSTSMTTGFAPMRPAPPPPGPDDPRLREAFAVAQPVYERLLSHAL